MPIIQATKCPSNQKLLLQLEQPLALLYTTDLYIYDTHQLSYTTKTLTSKIQETALAYFGMVEVFY